MFWSKDPAAVWRGCVLGAIVLWIAACAVPLPIAIPVDKTATVFAVDDQQQRVTMGAEYGRLQDPQVDWAPAREEAVATCRKRYEMAHAEPYGSTRRECIKQLGSDCVGYAILGDYQCVAQ